jgi:hypothetical protein
VNIIASLISLNSQVPRSYVIPPFRACLSALFSFNLASALCFVTTRSCVTKLENTWLPVKLSEWNRKWDTMPYLPIPPHQQIIDFISFLWIIL